MAWYDVPIRPFDPVIDYDQATGTIRYIRDSFTGNGQNSFVSAPAQPQDIFEELLNCMPIVRGSLDKRRGYQLINSFPAPALLSYEYQSDTNAFRKIQWCMQNVTKNDQLGNPGVFVDIFSTNEDGTTYNNSVFGTSILPPAATYFPSRMVTSRDYAYINTPPQSPVTGLANITCKWDGSASGGITNWGVTMPSNVQPIITGTGSGVVTLVSGRTYYLTFRTSSGNYSDLSTPSASTGPLANANVQLALGAGSTDPQVIGKTLLATADGGDETLLYWLADLPNNQTTYTDNLDELDLDSNPVYQELDEYGNQYGVADNTPAPQLTPSENGPLVFPIINNGRCYMAGQQVLYFSKSLADLTTSTGVIAGKWEECWPASYVMPVTAQAEFVTGLFADGVSLYIGTNRHIRILTGDGPTGTNPFVLPQVVFNDVGVANNETWKKVYQQGAPVGCMWLTPDLRVIGSNFSTYQDLGTPVQDVLSTVNRNVLTTPGSCHAVFYTDVAYDIYVLAVPTGGNVVPDTILMYDMRAGQWHTWKLNDQPTTLQFNLAQTGDDNWYMASADSSITVVGPNTPSQFDGVVSYPPGISQGTGGFGLGYGFNIPNTAVVTGIAVSFERSVNNVLLEAYTNSIFLEKNDLPAGVPKTNNELWTLVPTLESYGGPGDLWGTSWTPTDINNNGQFGFYFGCGTTVNVNNKGTQTYQTSITPLLITVFYEIASPTGTLWKFSSTLGLDSLGGPNGPAVIDSTAQTAWIHMGMPTDRKWLNEVELMTEDPNLLVTVEGASLMTDFNLPYALKSNVNPVISPLGPYKVFLANTDSPAKHRYYRLTFQSTSESPFLSFLGGYNLEVIPIHKL